MTSPVRPVVVISRCIDFDSCRYNGQVVRASLRDLLEPHAELRPICPELEIGLGVPRDPVHLVRSADGLRMLQPSTGPRPDLFHGTVLRAATSTPWGTWLPLRGRGGRV